MIAGVATARALLAEGVHPSVVAGMSIGAFGAVVAGGTLAFADALPLVHLRGEFGATLFLEVAPGYVSTHLVAALFPDVGRSRSQIKASTTRPCSPYAKTRPMAKVATNW